MTVRARQIGGLLLMAALAIALVTESLFGIIVSAGIAVVAGILLIRPPSPQFYVETTDASLVIKVILTNRISLRDIRAAELYRPDYSPFMRGFLNFFLMLGNLFGGGHELIKPDDRPRDVMIRLRKWIWVRISVPPFILPRKNWVLIVENAEALQADLQSRLEDMASPALN